VPEPLPKSMADELEMALLAPSFNVPADIVVVPE